MSFALLQRQQARLQEVRNEGTYDSVVEAVEASAAARAHTDEGRARKATKKKNENNNKSNTKNSKLAGGNDDLQHGGSISLNESVARKVAEARISSNVNKNIQDHQRRFLHAQQNAAENQKLYRANLQQAQTAASKVMRRKNEVVDDGGKKKKKKGGKLAL